MGFDPSLAHCGLVHSSVLRHGNPVREPGQIAQVRDRATDLAQCARAQALGLGHLALSGWCIADTNRRQGLLISFTNSLPSSALDNARRLRAALESAQAGCTSHETTRVRISRLAW